MCCRVSEQRRKRVQELGGQITDMKRKILEQGKMLKVKELSVRQCEKLNQEIQVCFGAVVTLVPSQVPYRALKVFKIFNVQMCTVSASAFSVFILCFL